MISLLVVNFRSAALAVDAIRSARSATSRALQVVVVDNSCDAAEATALEAHADRLIVAAANRGYAAGINLGRPSCDGEVIVIANPDIVFGAGAIDELALALESAAVAGPAIFWDSGHRWHLPPADLSTGWEKVDQILASRSAVWAAQRDVRRFRQRLDMWMTEKPRDVAVLSGAVMAVRRHDLDDVGGFDERFPLYFEEIDFLRRVSARRKRIVYVPTARCRHIYNQSAGRDQERTAQLFAESEWRYLEKWNGPLAAQVLKRLERPARSMVSHDDPLPDALVIPESIPIDDVVLEASPLASFATAAGHLPGERRVTIPQEILDSLRTDRLYVRLLRRSGEVLASYVRYAT